MDERNGERGQLDRQDRYEEHEEALHFTPHPDEPLPRPWPGPIEPLPRPLPPNWWRCLRLGPVSGRYEGEMTAPAAGRSALDLRVDIDPRYANSPVMNRLSGDFYQVYRFNLPGRPPISWRVYRESWIVDAPTVTWSRCRVEITGTVRFWRGAHPATTIRVVIPWSSFSPAGPAQVTFTDSASTTGYSCARRSHAFRDLKLEVDVCQSADVAPTLPAYDTHAHATRPTDLPRRTLTVEEAYREAGIDLTLEASRTIIDDSAPEFTSWSPSELHDAMETHFSRHPGGWPKWQMWGLLAGAFDASSVAGIMFDAAAGFGGAGEAPDRQGFAVFRNHSWFSGLPSGAPANAAEAAALRQFLYTWVHEAGHAFNFLHSWDKGRPDALSWMNYDWRYDGRNGADSFWGNFRLRFDDEELIHLRHGDRAAVIMGGDPWASGGHADAPPGAMSQMEGDPPLELLVRSKGFFAALEPVTVELRLRNLLDDLPLALDTQLDPEFGSVTVYIRQPSGRIVEYSPIFCKIATPQIRTLQPRNGAVAGADRYSQETFLSYGKEGFYFREPGEYLVRAVYQGAGDLLIASDLHRIQVAHPVSKEEERLAADFFSRQVGLSLYLGGSQSPFLAAGMATLAGIAERYPHTALGAKAALTLANSVAEPFFRLDPEKNALIKTHSADPEAALALTTEAVEALRAAEGAEARALNIAYHQAARKHAELLAMVGQEAEARDAIATLRRDLAARGVNAAVLAEIEGYQEAVSPNGAGGRRPAPIRR